MESERWNPFPVQLIDCARDWGGEVEPIIMCWWCKGGKLPRAIDPVTSNAVTTASVEAGGVRWNRVNRAVLTGLRQKQPQSKMDGRSADLVSKFKRFDDCYRHAMWAGPRGNEATEISTYFGLKDSHKSGKTPKNCTAVMSPSTGEESAWLCLETQVSEEDCSLHVLLSISEIILISTLGFIPGEQPTLNNSVFCRRSSGSVD